MCGCCGEELAGFFENFPDELRLDFLQAGVVGALAKLKGAAQKTMERRVQPLGLREMETELSDHLSMAGVLQTFRQQQRLRNVEASIVGARDRKIRMALAEDGFGHIKGALRFFEERLDLVQAACRASFRMILRKDVSPFWYAS